MPAEEYSRFESSVASPVSPYTGEYTFDSEGPFSPMTPVNPTPAHVFVDEDLEQPNEKSVFKGVTMEWSGITFSVTIKKKKEKQLKMLLSDVHGRALPGQILAVMGGSGAGKTTLLDALAGRLHVQGTMLINGTSVTPGSTGGYSKAYVFQGDNLHPMLTVGETLMFAAKFQLPAHYTNAQRREVVDKWLDLLGIKDIEDVKVGDEEQKGISGGQKRRLSIGIDLLKDPKIIFLDEPISGLDSTSAFKVVKAVHDIAAQDHRTVLMTIHQPSPRIMELLGCILILAQGRAVFQGSERDVEYYLRECSGRILPGNVSPIEYYLDYIDEIREEGQSLDGLVEFHQQRVRESASKLEVEYISPDKSQKSIFKDYITLCQRTWLIMLRTPQLFIGRAMFCLVVGFLFSTIFWNLKSTWTDATSIAGFFLMGIANLAFTSTEVMPMFAAERVIIRREYFQRAYGVINYILSQSTLWTLTMIPNSLLWTLSTYWSVGLTTDTDGVWTFLFTWLMWFCVMFCANALAMMMSAVIVNPMTSASATTAILAFMMVLCGFFIPRSQIPPYWIWFHWISVVMYAQYGFVVNYFGNMENTSYGCSPPNENDPTCSLTNTEILDYFDANDWNKWASVGALIAFGLLFRMLHCILLHLRFRDLRVKA